MTEKTKDNIGQFITLEGIEGSGKTTQTMNIIAFLQKRGVDCISTREPGGTRIGEKIRSILLDPGNGGIDPTAELLLYAAARADHIQKVIRPALAVGKVVVCDRYFDATLAYQCFGRGLDISMVRSLHALAIQELEPDITFLLDLPADQGLGRAREQIKNGSRAELETRFEKEDMLFHEKVRAGYLQIATVETDRVRIIGARQDGDQVRDDIINELKTKYGW
jgi:dTMP kinase